MGFHQSITKFDPLNYTSIKSIGKGAFGEIMLANRKSDNQKVAIKKMAKTVQKIGQLPNEFAVMDGLHHHGVAKVFNVEEDSNCFYIIMKYYNGDIFTWLDDYDEEVSPFLVLHITRQLIDAVGYCHSHNVVHRDIKLENLLWEGKKLSPHIVLADFGFTSIRPTDQLLYDYPGSINYASPELISGKPYYGVKSDVWAIGVCLYVLLTGEYPFSSNSMTELCQQITKSPVFNNPEANDYNKASEDCRNMIKWMLTKNPDDRPTIKQIQDHPGYKERHLGSGPNTVHTKWVSRDGDVKTGVPDDYIEIEIIVEDGQPWTPKLTRRKRG